jgi:hypothetical protein
MKIFVLNIRRIDDLTIYDRGDVFSGRSDHCSLPLLIPTRNMVGTSLYDLCYIIPGIW